MGECLITRRGGEKYELPILNSAYPANVSQIEKSGGSATFNVVIDTPGKPAEYTYQWYVNGSKVSGATESSYTKTGLTSAATYTVYCEVTNKAGTVQSRIATLTVQSSQPSYTYSGSHTLVKEGTYNWKLTLKSSGTLKFTHLGNCTGAVDVFLVGGGGGGSGCGGGGGYTKTEGGSIALNTDYSIVVGAGGKGTSIGTAGGTGGTSSALGKSVNGGGGGTGGATGVKGGDGGSGGGGYGGNVAGGAGGSNGGNGVSSANTGGTGQGSTTREFGSSSGTLYSGGGGGSGKPGGAGGSGGGGKGTHKDNHATESGGNGGTNTGGGGGGYSYYTTKPGDGGSGIVVIRNKR